MNPRHHHPKNKRRQKQEWIAEANQVQFRTDFYAVTPYFQVFIDGAHRTEQFLKPADAHLSDREGILDYSGPTLWGGETIILYDND